MKLSHRQLIILSGIVWFLVGVFLLNVGLRLILEPIADGSNRYQNELFMGLLGHTFGGVQAAALLTIALALIVGYWKGRYILGKSARKGVERILGFPNPTSLFNVYSPKYYILLGCMIGLGVLIKVFNVPSDLRGWIDVAIGAALINGAMIYFQYARQVKKSPS